MKFSKKASMQLSINAIVILVLAMAILGLGLGIVKMVKERADSLNIDVDLSESADSTKRIANVQDTFELRANKQNDMGISFYNTETACGIEGIGALIDIVCNENMEGNSVSFEILQAPARIESGTAGKVVARVKPVQAEGDTVTTTIKGSYACDFQVYCGVNVDETNNVFEHKSVIIDIIA